MQDRRQRPLRDLRISVTDRCNLRCSYCMPQESYDWIHKREILTFEEITRLARILVAEGVESVRLTGGEPLLRRGLDDLVARLASIPGLCDLSLTTNAMLLAEQAAGLRRAGLRRVNVSLDTLRADRFEQITRRPGLDQVLGGIEAARDAGLGPIKLNMVVARGVNEDEILPMLEFCRERGVSLRYIEFMDVGNANDWQWDRVVPKKEILEVLRQSGGLGTPRRQDPADPAVLYALPGGGDVGIIASVTEPFCGSCDRARLTAEGRLVTCLFSTTGTDLKTPLRQGCLDEDLRARIREVWRGRSDRFSEERLEALRSAAGYDPRLRRKLEMIALGG